MWPSQFDGDPRPAWIPPSPPGYVPGTNVPIPYAMGLTQPTPAPPETEEDRRRALDAVRARAAIFDSLQRLTYPVERLVVGLRCFAHRVNPRGDSAYVSYEVAGNLTGVLDGLLVDLPRRSGARPNARVLQDVNRDPVWDPTAIAHWFADTARHAGLRPDAAQTTYGPKRNRFAKPQPIVTIGWEFADGSTYQSTGMGMTHRGAAFVGEHGTLPEAWAGGRINFCAAGLVAMADRLNLPHPG